MRRISSHEPRYKHSTQGRKNRHADSRQQSQTSSSEEEDDSSDSEESESSSENESPQGGSFPSVADFNKRGAVKKTSKPETFMHTRIDGTKILMLDKVTQKNLLSPFPSFTLPPIYKEIVRPGIRRVPDSRRFIEDERKHSGKPPKPHPKRKETRMEEDESSGSIHKHSERSHRRPRDGGHYSKGRQSQRVLSCVSGCEVKDTSRRVLKSPPESEVPPKPAEPVVSPRKRKTEPRDPVKNVENRDEQRKTVRSAGSSVNNSAVRDSQKHIKPEGKGECSEGGGGEVKEKLVYVLEEKGKEKRKVETDLFTLNEILTIKKDLLELSEFAKKLKRMKEMAREPENGSQQNQQIYCHCKPASDLLRDVNRRIEALEARQEELEKGSKPGCRGDLELHSKKEIEVKTLSEYHSNVADLPKQSALSTAPSFHRMEMILPRADGFSNNSDIVNELMDIKTQLQKLEKRRMSKEVSESLECTDIMKQSKLDDRGIAVFSSKTYILTENLKKIEEVKQEVKPEVKPGIKPEIEPEASKTIEGNSKSDRTKGDVENWLRSVTPNHMENVTVCEMTKGPKSRGHSQKESQPDLKRKDCSTVSKKENFENQEQPKNRATGKGEKEADSGVIDLAENVIPGGRCSRHLQYKECIVTPSGKIFARITKSKTQPLKEYPMGSQAKPQRPQSRKCRSPELIRPTGSCSSIPSIPHAKEGRRRLQEHSKALKSKSVHELSTSSSVCKYEKTARNTSLKNSDKAEQTKVRGKRRKEDKNEFVKRLETHKRSSYRKPSRTSSSHSEFLASMNLDQARGSLVMDSSGFLLNSEKRDIILSYPATNEARDLPERSPCCSLYLEGESAKKRCKEERKQMKNKESELKKMLKKQIKEYERQKRKLKREQKRREVELINEFKCQKYKCLQKCKMDYDTKREALVNNRPGNSKKLQCTVKDVEEEDPCGVKTEVTEIQCKREDSATPESTESAVSPIWKKSDSLEIYKKTLKKAMIDDDIKRSLNDSEDRAPFRPMIICQEKRPVRPVCDKKAKREQVDKRWLQNFMRNLDLIYPRFCALTSRTNCHHEKKKKFTETCSWRSLCPKHSSRYKKCQNDEYAETESDESMNRHSKFANQHYDHHFYDYSQQPRPENFPCRCMRVYMQTQMQNGWSGLRAPRRSSTDTSTDLTRSRSAPTCESNKSSFVASGPKSQICLAAHESREEKCQGKCQEKCQEKCQKKRGGKRKHKKRGKKSKKRKHKSKKHFYNRRCKCRKCGNLHSKDEFSDSERSHAESGKSEKSKKKMATCSFSNRGRNGGDIFPMFSFLSHFCKSKPREKKFSLKRIAEIPQLKTCSTTRKKRSEQSSRKHRKQKRKSKDHLSDETPSSTESKRKKKKGKKKPRRCSHRKKQKKSDSESDGSNSDSPGSRKEKKRKKKKRKSDSENERSYSDSPGSRKEKKSKKKHKKKSSDEESERKKKKKKKKEKKEKKKGKCSSECTCRVDGPETVAYYQTIHPSKRPSKSPSKRPSKSPSKSPCRSDESDSTETTESSESSSSEEDRRRYEPKRPTSPTPQQKHRQIKDRLSSFHSFWKNFRKGKPAKPLPDKTEEKKIQLSSDSSFINDCSRSSEIPRGKQVVEMKAEPTSFAKIRKKRKKLSKEEKKSRKESRKESKKESTTPKSKSAKRRHI